MSELFRLSNAVKRDPLITKWTEDHTDELGLLARRWFCVMRKCGSDVREVYHDGYPTVCIADAAFAYVGIFKTHVNVGFFRGVEIPDPQGLLVGSGKLMRHVKLTAARQVDDEALVQLIQVAYIDMKSRVGPI